MKLTDKRFLIFEAFPIERKSADKTDDETERGNAPG